MLNGHFPFSFSHGTFYTHASHSSAASHWGFFVYLRMSLWPVEKVRVDKNLPYYLVQYAEPLHTPAAFLCQGWRSTGCPNLVLSIKRIATKMSIANSFLFAAAKNVYFERKWELHLSLALWCPVLMLSGQMVIFWVSRLIIQNQLLECFKYIQKYLNRINFIYCIVAR